MQTKIFKIVAVCLPLLCGTGWSEPTRTMRVEYYHTGNAATEMFSIDRVVVEPLPWPGNPARPIDDTNLGKYLFEVRDRTTNRILFSRGFDSIYGEWETTGEARSVNRTFHESLRFPAPISPVQVVIRKRDAKNSFREVWSTVVDPQDIYVDTSAPARSVPVIEIQKSGDPATKVDLLFLGEGYTNAQHAKCEKDIRRLAESIFTFSPFKERRQDFNLYAVCAAAAESGVSRPSAGIHRQTLFGSTFDAFGTQRYALSFDDRAIRTVASSAPYDALAIVMNESAYGNGGIFGQFASVSVDYPYAARVFIHEFGHHFAGLGDEYYFNANVAYESRADRVEPWEPNITVLLDPERLKWKEMLAPGVPLPTPWPKDDYEKNLGETPAKIRQMREEKRPDAEIAAFQQEARRAAEQALESGPYAGMVGAFEGALYEGKGYYRPQQRCIMISGREFCAVCQRAITRIIELDTGH